MSIFDLFSKRQKRLRGEVPDVYQYENFPIEFRRQIILIAVDAIGNKTPYVSTIDIYEQVDKTLCKEYGVFELNKYKTSQERIFNFLLETNNFEQCIDIIELLCNVIHNFMKSEGRTHSNIQQAADDAINELNHRFKEHGIGYQFEPEANEIIRVDSQFIHSEVVKPVLKLLTSDKLYQGANDEFLSAHDHYRHGKYKECLNDCLKSFESFLKAVHEKHRWKYNKDKDTARNLIKNCFEYELIPSYMQSQFDSLRNLLESGLPTIRNRESGHGDGVTTKEVPEHLASYALHLTATNLLFLSQCEEKL